MTITAKIENPIPKEDISVVLNYLSKVCPNNNGIGIGDNIVSISFDIKTGYERYAELSIYLAGIEMLRSNHYLNNKSEIIAEFNKHGIK